MLTVGGAISGYSEIGRARSTSTPAMVRMIDSTAAKIGRSMKKWVKRIQLFRGDLAARRMDRALVRNNSHAWSHERICQAADHHPIGRRQSRGDDAQAARHAAQGDRLGDNLIVLR